MIGIMLLVTVREEAGVQLNKPRECSLQDQPRETKGENEDMLRIKFSPSKPPELIPITHAAIIKAWIKFSAARFCSGVPDIRAIRSPREDLESEISTVAPEIWIETTRHE